MQHKRKHSVIGLTIALLLAVIVASGIMLMNKDITPVQQAVEKSLDASAFLGKQQ